MDNVNKKIIKKTTYAQFQKLTTIMEEYPHLATGRPVFGSSRATMEATWDSVADKLNSIGPPERSGSEWKKIWADQKSRTKKKISSNNKSLRETGGGPCRVSSLTDLEVQIDRMCNLSSAAAPSGNVFGFSITTAKNDETFMATPPRGSAKVAVVTPTTNPQKNSNLPTMTTPNKSTPEHTQNILMTSHTHPTKTSTPKHKTQSRTLKRKQNTNEKEEQIKILKKQVQQQNEMLEAMKSQAESAKACAEAAKVQAEALVDIADAQKVIANALVALINHLK